MSLHYEVGFSCYLLDDTPSDVMDELRWHLGLPGGRSESMDTDGAYPLLRPDPGSPLPGGDFGSLRRQLRGSRAGREVHAWGLFTRHFWLDDDIGEMTTILELISPHVADDGYGGYFREEYDAEPTAFVFRDRGYGSAHQADGQRD